MPPLPEVADAAGGTPHSDTVLAVRSAFQLGGSLLLTWGIAIAMRLWLPRYLGPERFGVLSFADAFTTTVFVVLGLGVDVYVRKQIATPRGRASEFFGGAFVLRAVMTAALFPLMALAMHASKRAPEVQSLVYVFACAQFFVVTNATLSALLHARGEVGGVSLLAVATKVLWALGVLLAITTHVGLWGLGASYLVSEAVETGVLFALARRHIGLTFRVDVRATGAVVVSSLPLYVNMFATTAYGKLDVTLLALYADAREVGWYAAASAIASLTLLVAPLVGWVVMPMFARAAARSRAELFAQIRRAAELILAIAIPASLLVSLGAGLLVELVFGAAFAPSALALRILASTFVLTYVAMVYAITLLMLERPWTLTCISVAGLGVNVALNLVLVRRSISLFGEGGGGAGCALAMLGTEVFVLVAMFSVVGREAVDRRTLATTAKSLGASLLVVLVDRALGAFGWARVVVDAVLYFTVVVLAGALRPRELAAMVTFALRRSPSPRAGGAA